MTYIPAQSGDVSGTAEWQSPDGKLLIGHCRTCDQVHYYPRRICPFCNSFDVDRQVASGKGTIYSYSLTHRGPNGPYYIAYVTLDEGVTMLTNIVESDSDMVAIGVPVELLFGEVEGSPVAFFRVRRERRA